MQMLPGRKSILYMSQNGVPLPQIIVHRFWDIVHMAQDLGVSFYTMDVEGLRIQSNYRPSVVSSLNAGGPLMLRSSGLRNMLLQDPGYSMNVLAKETGGLFIRDTNDFHGALEKIEEQRESYYLLSYVPKNQNFDGRYRHVEVKVDVPGAQVHAREGYYAVDAEFKEPLLEYEAPALALLQRGESRSDLPIEAEVLSFPRPDQPGLVVVLAGLESGRIAYTKQAEGAVSNFCFLTLFRNEKGEVARKISQQYRVTRTADTEKKGDGILFYRLTALPPGNYTVETAGFDAVSGKAATWKSRLTIPQPQSDVPGLSSVALIRSSEKAPKDESSGQYSPLRYKNLQLYPWIGNHIPKSKASSLSYFFTVYLKNDPAPTEARLQLLRLNQAIGEQKLSLPAPDEKGRIRFAGALALENLPTGTYTLRILIPSDDRFVVRSRRFLLVE